jgi:hypothetical protein
VRPKKTMPLPLRHSVPQSLSSWSSRLCLSNSGSKSSSDSHPSSTSRYTTTSHRPKNPPLPMSSVGTKYSRKNMNFSTAIVPMRALSLSARTAPSRHVTARPRSRSGAREPTRRGRHISSTTCSTRRTGTGLGISRVGGIASCLTRLITSGIKNPWRTLPSSS